MKHKISVMVEAMRGNSLKVGVVDFFSGCGGTSTGFSMADVPGVTVEIIAGIDNDPSACETFSKMHDGTGHCLDISELMEDEAMLEELVKQWNLDRFDKIILVGCAPCQGFSALRKTVEHDSRRHLFPLFAELATKISPDAIFMENVPDMFSKKHWEHYSQGKEVLEDGGYKLKSKIYNFAGFGLPQERFRAVMIAMKEKFGMPVAPIAPDCYKTVRDAIGDLPELKPGEVCPSDAMHKTSKHRQSTVDILKAVPIDGGNRPVGIGPECLDRAREKHGGYTDVYGRLAWDKPSVTITARCRTPSCGRFTHPEQHRGLSVREAALLQGFPLDFMFSGGFDDKFKQIGNAVPPIVAKSFAEHIIRTLTGQELTFSTSSVDVITKPVGPGFSVKINGIKKKRNKEVNEVAVDV